MTLDTNSRGISDYPWWMMSLTICADSTEREVLNLMDVT